MRADRLCSRLNATLTAVLMSTRVALVCRPYAVRRKIVGIVEKNKTITVVHGDLPRVQPVIRQEPIAEEEPMYRYGTFVRVIPASSK